LQGIFTTLKNAKKYSITSAFEDIQSMFENNIFKNIKCGDIQSYSQRHYIVIQWYNTLNLIKIIEEIRLYIEKYHELVILDTIDPTKTLYVMDDGDYNIFGLEPFITNDLEEANIHYYNKKGYMYYTTIDEEWEY
jgi:hypothetical protein